MARSGRPWEKEQMRYVKRLDEIGRGDIELAGGKGANLGELTRAGMPAPPGFVLSTAAYRAFVSANGLDEQILTLAQLPPDTGTSGYEAAADRIRTLFTDAEIPEQLAAEIAEARSALGDVAVAVRSSASRTPTSTSAATRCRSRCVPAGRRCGPPAPWPTGPDRASTRRRSAWL
jgi:phosphoenolpyruvate synthase/pyruvate phosphate dikinase